MHEAHLLGILLPQADFELLHMLVEPLKALLLGQLLLLLHGRTSDRKLMV